MSMIIVNGMPVDSDTNDVWFCDKCEQWSFDDDDCNCGESDQDFDYRMAIRI